MKASHPYAQFISGLSAGEINLDENSSKWQHMAAVLFLIVALGIFVASIYLGVKIILITWGMWMTGGVLGFIKWFFLYPLVSIPIGIAAFGVSWLIKKSCSLLYSIMPGKGTSKPRVSKTTRGGRVYEVRGTRMA